MDNSNDFKTISRDVWKDMRNGSVFQQPLVDNGEYKEDFYGVKENEDIDYDGLADFIFQIKKDHTIIFDWKLFAKRPKQKFIEINTAAEGTETRLITIHNTIPFAYKKENKEVVQTSITGKINKRIDYLEDFWEYLIDINAESEFIEAQVKFLYSGTKKFIVDAADTPEKGDFRIADMYAAVILTSANLVDFCYLIRDTVGDVYVSDLKELIAKKYCKKISESKSSASLSFLYQNAPDFVLNELHRYIDYDAMFGHMLLLTERDDTGFFSFLRDTSGAVINCMKAIGNNGLLFKKFEENPALVKRIFYNLDGSSTYNHPELNQEVVMTNKMIFGSFLNSLCKFNKPEEKAKGSFKIDDNHEINENAITEDETEKKDNTIFLQQQETFDLPIIAKNIHFGDFELDIDEDKGAYFLPFDFVNVTDSNGDTYKIAAIYAKAIAHEDEVKEIQQETRIGLDVFAIVIGVLTAGTGSGLGLALLDIGLASGDIIVALNEDKLMQTEEGRAFIKAWDGIMLIGVAFAGPKLIQGVFTNGAKLLRLATNPKTILAIEGSLISLVKQIKDLPKFVEGSLEIVKDFVGSFGISTFSSQLEKLYESGVALLKGLPEGEFKDQFVLIFNGKILSIGDLQDVISDVSEVFRSKGLTLIDKLKMFLFLLKKEKTLVNTSAKIGEEATLETIKWGTVKMKFHPRYEEMMRFLKERDVKVVEINNVEENVAYTETMIYDKSHKLLRVEKQLELHPEMRFLDLEHEIDHIIQFEKNLQKKFCTRLQIEKRPGVLIDGDISKLGFTTRTQKAFLEYEERIREIYRLKNNGVPKSILDEHFKGLVKAFEDYKDVYPRSHFDRVKFEDWKREYFPNFSEFDFNFFN